jgi:hypothetical protein
MWWRRHVSPVGTSTNGHVGADSTAGRDFARRNSNQLLASIKLITVQMHRPQLILPFGL